MAVDLFQAALEFRAQILEAGSGCVSIIGIHGQSCSHYYYYMAASMNKYAGASLGILATLSPYVDGPGGEIFRPVSYVTHRIHTEHVVEKIEAGKPPYPRFPSDPKDRDAITHTLWPLSDFLKYGSTKLTIGVE
uniref:Uncharacterized protein n=1 Tax=Coccidioides posadasii RMSCC 3488 TaxID=454284 RepID=A0A0J6I7K2_COCPO|nr:hypothetical protein CPAG_03771 [Coccidioides posadasii RMSCC 3488]